ncbi:MAG: AAA family ATPase [Dysgonomonas sp.]
MDITVKDSIKEALEDFLTEQNMTQNVFSEKCGVNGLYLKGIRSGDHTYVNSKEAVTPVADKWYYKIADYIGYKVEKVYWETRATPQLLRILATLDDGRKYGYTNIIIGETGSGKSYVGKLFQNKYIQEVFIVKIGKNDNVGDVLDKTIEALDIPDNRHKKVLGSGQTRSKSLRIRKIIKHLQELRLKGFNPVVYYDECEYMKLATLCAIKEFYDDLRGACSLVLAGTEQFLENLLELCKSDKEGMPQFYSRIKFGIRHLPQIDRKFPLFLEDIEDKAVKSFIQTNCNNYREVHDVLVPSLREADRLGVPLNVGLIREVLGID